MAMKSKKHKFDIGDTVYPKVERRGSYEPSKCRIGEKLTVDEIKRNVVTGEFTYVCSYDGYTFSEDELMSAAEYRATIK